MGGKEAVLSRNIKRVRHTRERADFVRAGSACVVGKIADSTVDAWYGRAGG